ncbi:S8 family peptidase [Microbulbifer epialgicus]|uniref:S8 family serine peptidase n=1 Tax=Microbulbifer epialgicus TaxID=393907 RepID=A0ABV4P1V3_9GAMM
MPYTYQYGGPSGKEHKLDVADDLVVIRTQKHKSLKDSVHGAQSQKIMKKFTPVISYDDADVTVLKCRDEKKNLLSLRDAARKALKKEPDVRFAGRVLREEGNGSPILYTENLFIKFRDDIDEKKCESIIAECQLTVKERVTYANNSYFVQAKEGIGLKIFELSKDLLNKPEVELCHPELIKKMGRRQIGINQWHLAPTKINGVVIDAHINLMDAWKDTKGEGVVIAIIDDGVDVDHEEFSSTDKIVSPWDATLRTNDPRPKAGDNHGTPCAGVACADGNSGASGVAPKAKLMPIRFVSSLGSLAEANAFAWAADHGADVISCSWGPEDGNWWDPNDPKHQLQQGLPDSTRLALDYAINSGREGKGCVIIWAAGNGYENIENDGYASYEKVIAVAACNDRGKHSVYSDYGESVWCAFPSNDSAWPPYDHPDPLTPGIWTTDNSGGSGYNPGKQKTTDLPPGDTLGNYTGSFGGTSSSCPGVAGIAALILSVNPDLNWQQVKMLIRQSCERIDENNGDYNEQGHSPLYGFGRPDSGQAVKLAIAAVK